MATFRFCPLCGERLLERISEGRVRSACAAGNCDFVHYDNPVPVVAALVEHGEAVLLVRNRGWPETWFGLVSGFLERGENPEEGVLREVREELGLQGKVISFIGAYPFEEMNQLILAYHVQAHGEVSPSEELAGVKAVPPHQLRPWPLGTGPAVRDWLLRQKQEPTVA